MKHSKYLIILLLWLSAIALPGQNILRGKIFDKDSKEPLYGVAVYISDLKIGTITDTAGYFELKNLPKGKFLTEIKLLGYASELTTVSIPMEQALSIYLAQSAGELNEVVVTGESKATEASRSPIPIVAVNHEYLLSNVSTNAIDALTRIPGITAVTTGPNISKPFIRGLGFNRILTLYDGFRQEGQQWGDEHGIEVDQYGVDRVEILKGPASLSYGSDALAGVVNLIPTRPAPEGKMIAEITGDYGSNNNEVGGSGMIKGTKNGIDWIARVSHKQAMDYQDKNDGRVFGTAFSETDASGSVGIHRSWGYSHINFSLYDDLQEIPDGSRDSVSRRFTRQITEADSVRQIVSNADLNSYHIEALHQHVQHYRVIAANNFQLGSKGGTLDVNVGFQRSVRREFSHPVLSDIPGLYLQLNTISYDVKYHMPEMKHWNFTVGFNGMYQNNNVTAGTDFVIPSYSQIDFGPFAIVKRSYGKFDFEGGLRYDVRIFNNDQLYTKANPATGFDMPVASTDTAGTRIFAKTHSTFQGLTGSIGATYNANKELAIKFNFARGFRAPNISELSANGVHPGTNIYQLGNSDFKPEYSWQADFGLSYSTKYVALGADVFYNYIQNYIYNQKLSGINGHDSIIVAPNQTFQFQQASAQLYGGEISLDIHPIKSLHIDNGLSLVYADFLGSRGHAVADSERYLPSIPPLHGTSEVRFDFKIKKAHIVNGFVKVGVAYYARQNRIYSAFGTETSTPGYALLNAGFGGGFTDKKGRTVLNLYVLGSNLLNSAYQDHLSRLKYFEPYPNNTSGYSGIYNMGTNITIKVVVPLEFNI
jgi:iron complex outermembrane receptor protein